MLAARRERLVGAGRLILAQGVATGELPSSLDVDAVTRGILALLDGLMLQRIEAGDAYRPADLERRANAIVELLLASGRLWRPTPNRGQSRRPRGTAPGTSPGAVVTATGQRAPAASKMTTVFMAFVPSLLFAEMPPAMRTRPSAKRTACPLIRGSGIAAIRVHAPVVGW